jgi:hypothetical protein
MSAAKTMPAFEPYCERITWRPGGKSSERNWVCSEEEGKCQGCRDEEWHRYNQEIVGSHYLLVEREARHQKLYRTLFKADDLVVELITEYFGTHEATIAAILDPVVGYEDFHFLLPTLLAWDKTYIEALRSWQEDLERADELVAEKRRKQSSVMGARP